MHIEDQILCNEIFTVYLERGKLLDDLGYRDKAQASFHKAEKWRFVQDAVENPALSATHNQSNPEAIDNPSCNGVAHMPLVIFPQNVTRSAIKHRLPKLSERIASTPQLAYCLGLLSMVSMSPSSSLPATEFEEQLDESQQAWILATVKDEDEQERLRSLAMKVVVAFINDSLQDPATVAEVVHLAPVLEKELYRKLLNTFIDGIGKSTLLDLSLLEGLAQLIQSATPDYLMADDLVRILRVLNTCLQDTHQQSTQHLYGLSVTVSRVLDAMADSEVRGLSREQLHAPLSAYLDGLKGSSDPYLVYQAAYAYQALQYIPDDETSLQAVLRRTSIVVRGISGFTSAVKGLDLSGCLEGLAHLHEGLGEVYKVAVDGYMIVTSLVESGQGLLDSLKEGFTFSQRRTWYPALRATDDLLRDGRLADFKRLVCEVPCRRDPAFQWGLCLRLGETAVNPLWDASTRLSAIDFLGEMYKNDADWGHHASVKQWILTIFGQLSDLSESAIKDHAHTLLQELEKNGDAGKQALYHGCINEPPSPYPLRVCLPSLTSPSLISRVQDIPDVEVGLRKLRAERLMELGNGVYIPPQAKASLQASNDVLFPLMENVKKFLTSDRQVFLLLGESGAGKSTFNRELECDLWDSYKKGEGRIPLFINLSAINRPDQDLIAKHLRRNDFTEPQIREMKNHREFILICDGYDESQQSHNLYNSNQLNQPGQWQAKMVISCRSEFLGTDRDRFQPTDRNERAAPNLYQEAVIAPFSATQIQGYIKQYVSQNRPPWKSEDYLNALDKVPNLLGLVKNPFLLTLSLEVLPRVVDVGQIQDLTGARITRVALYDQFVEQWLERGKKRVGGNYLNPQATAAFDTLVDGGFTQNGIHFLKKLASAIYKEQAGHPVVEYSYFKDEGTWKTAFFSREDEIQLLREACPLVRNGNQYRFIHQSLLEYCFALAVFDPRDNKVLRSSIVPVRRGSASSIFSFEGQAASEEAPVSTQESIVDHPLAWRSFVGEPSILEFLAERAQQEPLFKQQLLDMIERSKTDKEGRIAAANAITIMVRAGIRFNGADLKDIRIPGADLSGGEFDRAQMQGADLRKVNLRNIWLRQADLSNAQMTGAHFGEWPYLTEDSKVHSCAYSPDGGTCAMGLEDGTISVYDTSTWARIHTLSGHTLPVMSVVYSPSGQQIASGSHDMSVRLWDAQTGAPGPILSGHTSYIASVAYSPSGQQIASGSYDNTVRLWDAQTGVPGPVLSGHTDIVSSVVYSPCGLQIASGGYDDTVRLWDAQTGTPRLILNGHTSYVTSVVFSPSGQQIASGSYDDTVRLWDAQTGEPGPILCGHTSYVTSVVYSPRGQQIASGSQDMTVRLWDAQTGTPGPILSGHTDWVESVMFSPNGQQIASASADMTVRLWDARTSAFGPISSGHTSYVMSVAYSTSGQQIVSGSDDKTVRLWDAQTGESGSILSGHTSYVMSAVHSPSGQQIASGSCDTMVRLWDARTGEYSAILSGHTDTITSVVFSTSGQQIASGSYDKTVRLWDAQTGTPGPILRGHTGPVQSVAISPSCHQIASGSWDKTVRLWDAQTGTSGPILNGHASSVTCVVYSPSGQQIASGSWDMTVQLWDAHTSVPGLTLRGHTDYVTCVAYSPCGQKIASGSREMTVRLWDVDSGQCLAVVECFHGAVNSIAWNPASNGAYFATGCDDKSVRVWQVMEMGDRCHVCLHWSSTHGRLIVSDTNTYNVQGLSKINMKLLKQRGAVGEPIPSLSLRGAGEKLISMASVVSQLDIQSSSSMLNTYVIKSSREETAQSIVPSNSAQLAREPCNRHSMKAYYSMKAQQVSVNENDTGNLTRQASISKEVDPIAIIGNIQESLGVKTGTSGCTINAMEELEKRLQEHMELQRRQQEHNEEQKQNFQELKDAWKEQQQSYEMQMTELK
ncbi:hypothetical protein BGZ50_007948, partial [Haplosporangium sp. Z 11]